MITREPLGLPRPTSRVDAVGRWLIIIFREVGIAARIFFHALLYSVHIRKPRVAREVIFQMFAFGIKSLGVITVVALFTGMILALQTGLELKRFNQEALIGTAVMVSMLREMGPFMTGLILAACVGSSIAAQMGTMTVSDEIAALEIMSIDPVRFLVMPRLIAMMIMTPLLSFYTCIMGVLGGGLVGATQLGVSWSAYINNATLYADEKDLFVGLFKALIFGSIIVTESSYEGFLARQGAVGVGMATRRAVLVSFLLILVTGYFVTRLFYI